MSTDKSWGLRIASFLGAMALGSVRRLMVFVGVCLIVAEIVGVVVAIAHFRKHRDRLKSADRKDPYAYVFRSPLGKGDVSYTRLASDGTTITIDNRGAMFLGDVLKDNALTDRLFPTYRDAIDYARENNLPLLPSVGMIHHYLKTQNDLLIEAVQLEVNRETRLFLRDLLKVLLDRREDGTGRDREAFTEAAAFVATAISIAGDLSKEVPDDVTQVMGTIRMDFKSGRRSAGRIFNESKVAERYAQTDELATMFRQERFLMGALSAGAAAACLAVLSEDRSLKERFIHLNAVHSVTDNPTEETFVSLADLLKQHDDRDVDQWRRDPRTNGAMFIATANSRENANYYRLLGNRPLPPGASWMTEVVRGIRTGEIDTSPTADSGWYDYQLHSLVPLLRSDHSLALGTKKLCISESYTRFLEDTFRSCLAADRETHVLRIEPPYLCRLLGDGGEPLELGPHFSCEPMPAVYFRLSRAYGFLRRRIDAAGYSAVNVNGHRLDDLLAELETAAMACSALSLLELGIPPDGMLDPPLPEGFPQSLQKTAEAWLQRLPDDEAMAGDKRFAIDVAAGRKWANVGVRFRRLKYEFQYEPKVLNRTVVLKPSTYYAPVSVFAEFDRQIPRGKFGGFCDRYKSVSRCLAALGAQPSRGGDDRIPIENLLFAFGLIVALDLVLTVLLRKRRRIAWTIWSVRLAAFLTAAFLAGTDFGRTALALHVAPRFQAPRVPLGYATHDLLSDWLDYSEENLAVKSTRDMYVDWLIARAVSSDSKPVRENALNLYDLQYHTWGPGPRTIEALLRLCETRGFEETRLAMLWTGGMANSEFSGVYQSKPDLARRHLPRWLGVLERFGNAPSLVLRSASVFRAADDRAVLPLLTEAIENGSPSDKHLWSGILTAIFLQKEKLPLDVVLKLGRVDDAHLPKGGAGNTNDLWGGPVPDSAGMIALVLAYDKMHWDIHRWNSPYTKHPGPNPELRPHYRNARNDLRIPDIVFRVATCEPLAGLLPYTYRFPEYMGPAQRERLARRMAGWFIDPATSPADPAVRRAMDYFLWRWFAWDADDKDEKLYAALKQIHESGTWHDPEDAKGASQELGKWMKRNIDEYAAAAQDQAGSGYEDFPDVPQ